MLWESKEGASTNPDKRASLKVEMPKQSTKESTGITQKSVGKHIPESGAQEPTLETASGSVSRVDNEK